MKGGSEQSLAALNGQRRKARMSGRLQGKVALVTAAGQGIGRAIAEKFAGEGAKVIATDLDPNKLEGLRAKLRKLDVLIAGRHRRASAETSAANTAPLDILVNCAGYVHHGTVLDCCDKDWEFSFDLNVKSMHRTIKTFLPAMLEKKAGIDRQHRIHGVFDPRHSQPLRLRRHQSRGDRPHQGGRRRFHQAGHPLQCHLPRDDRIALARGAHHASSRTTAAARPIRCARTSSRASRWGGWDARGSRLARHSSLAATKRATLPARPILSMAAWHSKGSAL